MQPIWIEGERSVEFCSSSLNYITAPKPPPSFPRRVSVDMLKRQESSRKLAPPLSSNPDYGIHPSSSIDTEASSSCSDSEAEIEVLRYKQGKFVSTFCWLLLCCLLYFYNINALCLLGKKFKDSLV